MSVTKKRDFALSCKIFHPKTLPSKKTLKKSGYTKHKKEIVNDYRRI